MRINFISFRTSHTLTMSSPLFSPLSVVSSSSHMDSCFTKEPSVDLLSTSSTSWLSLSPSSPSLEAVELVSWKFFVFSVCWDPWEQSTEPKVSRRSFSVWLSQSRPSVTLWWWHFFFSSSLLSLVSSCTRYPLKSLIIWFFTKQISG